MCGQYDLTATNSILHHLHFPSFIFEALSFSNQRPGGIILFFLSLSFCSEQTLWTDIFSARDVGISDLLLPLHHWRQFQALVSVMTRHPPPGGSGVELNTTSQFHIPTWARPVSSTRNKNNTWHFLQCRNIVTRGEKKKPKTDKHTKKILSGVSHFKH